ncbi:SRPBCC family protein [Nocardiopsis ganjiahuensis]|uniref:SRPBCC family protein n=1 Tax=Nocardiopsis ganjiahuensis TaxID=239984 RepID=UPI000344F79B|nr:SRPBCC family protein [Nocardiopsis ganjiahuensis]
MEWTGARYADTPTIEEQIRIDAPPETVWGLVGDITLMPGTSKELRSVEWAQGWTGPEVGARFVGHNAHKDLGEWSTTSTIVEYEAPRTLAWAVGEPEDPSATWRFTLEPEDGATVLRQWMRLGPGRSGLSYAIDLMPDKEQKIVFVRMRELEAGIRDTLAAIRDRAEAAAKESV